MVSMNNGLTEQSVSFPQTSLGYLPALLVDRIYGSYQSPYSWLCIAIEGDLSQAEATERFIRHWHDEGVFVLGPS